MIKLLAFDYIGPATPFLLYFASIIAGAWFGGWTGGLAVTALSALLGLFLFMPPYHALRPPDIAEAVRLGFFFLEGLALTAITTWLRAEQRRCDTAVADAQGSLAKLEGVLHGVEAAYRADRARGADLSQRDAAR